MNICASTVHCLAVCTYACVGGFTVQYVGDTRTLSKLKFDLRHRYDTINTKVQRSTTLGNSLKAVITLCKGM